MILSSTNGNKAKLMADVSKVNRDHYFKGVHVYVLSHNEHPNNYSYTADRLLNDEIQLDSRAFDSLLRNISR